MAQFRFNTISRIDIERSTGGAQMIHAIDFDGTPNQLIVGMPGSGKTTVTIMRAQRLANEGKNIMLYTFQTLLQSSLLNIADENLKTQIASFYEWYYRNFGFLQQSDTEVQMIDAMRGLKQFDEILIDEGQDFEARIYRALIPYAKKLTVGADTAQKIHDKGLTSEEIESELKNKGRTEFVRLQYNYRNPFGIYNFARYFLPDNDRAQNETVLSKITKGRGTLPTIMQVRDEKEQLERIKVILTNNEGRNCGILFYLKSDVDKFYAKLKALGFSCTKHHHDSHAGANIENILVTTYKSAKGLEFQSIILPDMQNAKSKYYHTDEHYYVACTRSQESLFLLFVGQTLPNWMRRFPTDSYTLIGLSKNNPVQPVKKIELDVDDLPF